ncbi:hypothetical protein FIM08_02685 [SAR202 cluster bacterium AC-647-N09_OGT_505m]|mgnify:FL=1|nr:hypothetical protein [SAR202 cluster bacterium AC-647-N09_OGT_505m]
MPSHFDLHIHTSAGSPDSALSPLELVSEIKRLGLTGALVTEHNGWQRHEFERFAKDLDVVLIRALEVGTDWGHMIALGLDGYAARFFDARDLRKAVLEVDGFMIIAHPFRFLFEPAGLQTRNILYEDPKTVPASPEEAMTHPIFQLVDEIEVVNGANSERENRFAQKVAGLLGKRGTGGSDAHSIQGIAKGATLFHGDIRGEKDLLEALKAGAFTPMEGFNSGRISYYGDLPA